MTSISHVQKVGSTSGNGVTTVKVIPTTATTPGNTLIAVAVWYPSSGAYPTGAITDSAGNTYTTLYSFAGSSGTGPSFLIAAAFRAASVGLTPAGITATFSTGPFSVLLVDEWSAVGQTQDGSTVTGSGSGTSVAVGPLTISAATSLILAYVASFGNLSTTTWTSGWTAEFQSAAPTASLGYQLPGTTGSYSGTATLSSTEIWQSAMYALEVSGPYVSPVGTPALAAASASNSMSIAGSWGTGQARTAGDLLVAAVTAYGTTTAVLGAAPSGWTLACADIVNGNTISAHYTKVATGSDSAPTFTATATGTSGDQSLQVVLHEWSDSAGGTPVLYSTGLASGTSGTITATSGATLPSAGCGAVASAICSQGTTAATTTWTTPAGWNLGADQLTSLRSQMASYYATPATSGSALSALFTHSRTSTFQAATLIIVAPSGTTPGPMVVQQGAATGATVSSLTAGFGAPTNAGDCLFAVVSTPVNDATVSTVKLGTSADNWAAQVSQTNATYTVASIWADPDNAGGQSSVAVTLSGSDSPSLSIYEVSGLAASSPLDKSAVAEVNGTGATWSSGATATITTAPEFVLGMVAGYNNAGPTPTMTGPSGWSNQPTLDAATGLFQLCGYQLPGSTAAFTYSGTSNMTSPNNYYAALVGTFLPAGGTENATASQTLAPSQSAAANAVRSRTASQTVAVSQSAAAAKAMAASQTLSSSQSAAAYATRSRTAAQTITPSQSAAAAGATSGAQTITASQSAAAYAIRPGAATQTLAPSQSAAAAALRTASATQTVTPGQSAAAAATTSASQTVTPAGTAAVTVLRPAAASQTADVTQAAAVTAVRPASATQTVSPSQSAAGEGTSPGSATASQTLSPSQAAAAYAIRSPTEAQALTPSQSAAGSAVRPATASQTLSPSESAAAGAVRSRTAAQTVAPGQSAAATRVRPATASQTLAPAQSATALAATSASQTVTTTQAGAAHAIRPASASQTLSPSQSATVATIHTAAASQAIALSQGAVAFKAGSGAAAAQTVAPALQSAAFTVVEPAPATQPAVPDFIAGYAPQTADFNAWIQAPFAWLTRKVIFRAELSAATTWTQGANTLIPFNIIDEDTYSGWNASTHTWTPPGDGTGTYEVSLTASAAAASDGTTALRCGLYLNGSALYTMSSTQASQSQPCLTGGSAPIQLYGGQDTISAYAYWNTTSGNGSAVTTAGQRATMQITWLSL